MEGGLKSFLTTFKENASDSHQKSKNGDLHGTINCTMDSDSVIIRYVYKPLAPPVIFDPTTINSKLIKAIETSNQPLVD